MSDTEQELGFEIARVRHGQDVTASDLANRLVPWLAAHDAELTERVRAEQIETDAQIADIIWEKDAPPEASLAYAEGWSDAASNIGTAIREVGPKEHHTEADVIRVARELLATIRDFESRLESKDTK